MCVCVCVCACACACVQLMKIGFDDETSQSDINGLEQQLIQLRNPASITLGIKSLSAADVVSPEELNLVTLASLPKKASYKREQKNKSKWLMASYFFFSQEREAGRGE